jgi:enoyl-CoA hydratase/carnithine racemase
LPAAQALAREFAGNAPLSLRGAKVVLEAIARDETEAKAEAIEQVIDTAMDSEDYREAARAFLDKRKPNFIGR